MASINPDIEVSIPRVMNNSTTPDIYKESDSVSTFRSLSRLRTKSLGATALPVTKKLTPLGLPTNRIFTPLAKVTFPHSFSANTPSTSSIMTPSAIDDGSISKMSDTASRLSAFESRFDSVAQGFTSSLQLLRDQSGNQAKVQKEQSDLLQNLMRLLLPSKQGGTSLEQPSIVDVQLNVPPARVNLPSQEPNAGDSLGGVAGPG
jgi:hypothetical protein